jgi:hypothetical protein
MSVADLIEYAGQRGWAVRVAAWPDPEGPWKAQAECHRLDGSGGKPRYGARGETAAAAADKAAADVLYHWHQQDRRSSPETGQWGGPTRGK